MVMVRHPLVITSHFQRSIRYIKSQLANSDQISCKALLAGVEGKAV